MVLARAGVGADEVRWVGVGTGAAAVAALRKGASRPSPTSIR
jgi:hypothetical protein